jgi:hypothetical protein
MLLKVFAVAATAGKGSEIYRGVKELYLLFVLLLRSFQSSLATFSNPQNRFNLLDRKIVCETIKERRKKSSTDFSTCFNQVFCLKEYL